MNGWFMPAPAPCANTYRNLASVFAKQLVETLEDVHQLGLHIEHFDHRIVTELLHPLQRVGDRPIAVVELRVDFIPFDRHRNGSAGRRSHAIRRYHELPGAVLERVDVYFAIAFADRA